MGAVLADILLVLLVFLWIFEQMFEKYRPQLTGASGPALPLFQAATRAQTLALCATHP